MIGPTFASELTAAGLAGTPCSWGDDGTYNIDQLTDTQKTTFLQVLAAHDPTKQLPPQSVSPRQIRLALTQTGMRQQVEDYVTASSLSVQDSWHYATEFLIDNALLVGGMQALGKTDADRVALFQLASTL